MAIPEITSGAKYSCVPTNDLERALIGSAKIDGHPPERSLNPLETREQEEGCRENVLETSLLLTDPLVPAAVSCIVVVMTFFLLLLIEAGEKQEITGFNGVVVHDGVEHML